MRRRRSSPMARSSRPSRTPRKHTRTTTEGRARGTGAWHTHGRRHDRGGTTMNRLLIAMMAAALAGTAYARMPFDSNQPSNEEMQKDVQSATGGPSAGASAGLKANELAKKSDTSPVLQTNEEKQQAVAKATGGPSAGAAAGLAAKKS